MDFDGEVDRLQLQHLAGGNIVQHPPLYAPGGELLFIISDCVIQIYSTTTGEVARQLTGASSKIVAMELELRNEQILVACTENCEILRWRWASGTVPLSTVPIHLTDAQVLTFNQLNFYGNSETACAFVTVKSAKQPVQWFVIDTSSGMRLNVPAQMRLIHKTPLVAVGTNDFKIIVVVQGPYVHFVDYQNWFTIRLKNANEMPVTVVSIHPKEELVATGDDVGRIFLWRQFWDHHTVCTSLYHWHHTSVTSLAFSVSGSSFYSSGLEAVLVKWNIAQPDMREFIPRMAAVILHIAVSPTNAQVAVCTADNGVQLVGGDNTVKCTLQEFTYITDDKTGKPKFPVGLRLDPRTNTLVLNGRSGHLQFYSAYTKNMLYNMDIVGQNTLSMESDKILYNIRVTKAAFNIDWVVTGEVYNDEEHLPELRLKFWKYVKETQSYKLNTNVELPHEGGFKVIEFSNDYQVDNLLCATVGEDNIIKIWSLEETDSIYKKGKVWYCIAQTSYKSMPIQSISFSQDGSLLAAGFGNTLCIYKADTLKLKAALTGTGGSDGCIPKAQVRIPKQTMNGAKSELVEQRKRVLQLFTNLLDNNEETLIKEIRKSFENNQNKKDAPALKPLEELNDKQKQILYNKILKLNELNLFQKVLLFQKLKIYCEVHPQWQQTVAKYLRDTVAHAGKQEKHFSLHDRLHRVNERDRFKAKYRLHRFATRKRIYDEDITINLVPILNVMNLYSISKQPQVTNGNKKFKMYEQEKNQDAPGLRYDAKQKIIPPTCQTSEISHVQFAAGEYAHLVIVCTPLRVLIWNLLTLRLQSVLKLSVQHLCLDPQTNLIAAFTQNNELHVFQPNVPLPIYQRRNLPNIYGAIWLARGYPKPRSINLDWQAQSTLYFLTESQEIMYLGSPEDASSDAPPPIAFKNEAVPELRYSTFGTFATKQINEAQTQTRPSGTMVLYNSGKTAIKTLIEMSTHTMPPLSLLCGEFVKSLVKPADMSNSQKDVKPQSTAMNGDVIMNGKGSPHSDDDDRDDDEDDDDDRSHKLRKSLLTKTQEINQSSTTPGKTPFKSSAQITEEQLQRVADQMIDLEF